MADPNVDQKLKNVIQMIEKEIDKGAIMRLGESSIQDVQGISTGSLSLDIALGGKGLPRGRIVEIYGPEASGKTTVTLHAVAEAQKNGGVAAFIDAEHALDPGWAKRIGVDLDSLLVSQPSCAEEALRIAEMLVKSNAVDLIVIDSVAALVPRAEVDGEIGDSHVGVQARLMSQALRILTPSVSKSSACVIFINQIRQKIGVMFGNPETTSGGLALKFYASVRLDIRRTETLKQGDEVVGSGVRVKVVKNKVAPPFRIAEFELLHERGINREGDLLELAVADKIIERAGGNHRYNNDRIAASRDAAKEWLRDNPTIMEDIRRKVLIKRGMLADDGSATPAPEETESAPTPAPSPRSRKQAASSE